MIARTLPSSGRIGSRCLLAMLFVVSLSTVGLADPTTPGPSDRNITVAVTRMIGRQHLLRHPLDKEISERCFKLFLKTLDPMKVYFYQSDIDEFNNFKDQLADKAYKGDVSFAYKVFSRFLLRLDERVKLVDELLAAQHDFTADEEMLKDRDLAQYAKTPEEAQDRWRKRIKYELLDLKADKEIKDGKESKKKDSQDPREKLSKRYHSFAKYMHQTASDELLEMYLNALTMSFDPHTSYMSPESQENFDIAMRLELEGVGASLQSDDGYTVVKKIIPGGALDKFNKAALKTSKDGAINIEDKIVGVAQGDDGEMVDVIDMKLRDVVKLIRGKRNTVVRVEVIPVAGGQRKVFRIVREKIELKDSEAKGEIFDVGRKADGKPYRIGVIDLPSFYRDMTGDRRGAADVKSTTRDVRVILENFKSKGIDAVVLDLRRNGGGALNEAISLTGLFINEGPVVQVKDADGHVQPLNDADSGIVWSGPLVVLISKFSASASEILAGAIQDYGRGLIIGDRSTHGKGTVQSLMDLGMSLFRIPNAASMGALKITMQQFYRPNGDSTQKRGVVSDIELPSLTTHLDVGEADLDYPVSFDRVTPLNYEHFNEVTPAIRNQLKQLSDQRIQASEKFQKVFRTIARYKELKANKYVTLNEAKFMKERADLNADKEEEKAIGDHSELNDGNIHRDFYLDEVLAITADFLNIQHIAKAQRAAR